MYNVLVEIALYRRTFGGVDELLQEMKSARVVPNDRTLELLLQSFTLSDWKQGKARALRETFAKEYGVLGDWKCALIEVKCFGRAGMAEECTAAFRKVPALRGRRDAWFALVEAHCLGGQLREASSLLRTMEREGQRPDIAF